VDQNAAHILLKCMESKEVKRIWVQYMEEINDNMAYIRK
jgi:hypothetical protein